MRRLARLVSPTLVVGVLLAPVAAAGGASDGGRVSPVLGPDFRISGPAATGQDDSPAVAWNGITNEFLVVWMDDRDMDSRGYDIYGRRVGADGVAVGTEFRISGAAAIDHDVYPEVAWNGAANEFLVVWQDWRNAATRNWDIYGRRVSAAGSPVGGDFRISGRNATSDEYSPAVAWGGAVNEFLVVWRDERNAATRGSDIYGQRVAADGIRVGHNIQISGRNATSFEFLPKVAWAEAANRYLVVWGDGRGLDVPSRSIYGRLVEADGTLAGTNFHICGRNSNAGSGPGAVVWNGNSSQYLVVWSDWRDWQTRGLDIYGRRVSLAGDLVGRDFRISGRRATADESNLAIVWNDTATQGLIVWEDSRAATTRGYDILGRPLAADGTPDGGAFRISGPGATANDLWPAVAWNETDDQYLVVWEDRRSESTRGRDIYGRRVAG